MTRKARSKAVPLAESLRSAEKALRQDLQERKDGMRMEFGFPGGTGEPEKSYFLKSFFLPKPAKPTRPEPRSSMVAGSGTGAAATSNWKFGPNHG
jgi:hypothetical protein